MDPLATPPSSNLIAAASPRAQPIAHFVPPVPSVLATVADYVARHARLTPTKVAFDFRGDGAAVTAQITYAELDARAENLAGQLMSRGLNGQRAILLFPPGLDFIVALVACWHAGVVAVPAFPPHRNRHARRVASILKDARPAAALTTENLQTRVRQLCAEEGHGAIDVVATDQPLADASNLVGEPTAKDLALLQYTSGSTGAPKGVCLTHANLLANAQTIANAFAATSASHGVFWLPMYHDMGLVGGIVVPLLLGASNTLLPATHFLQQPLKWLQLISQTGADIAGGPNFAYDLCVAKTTIEDREQLDLSGWRVAFNGAEPVRSATIERFAAAFADCGFRQRAFYPCYGMAEATLLITGGDVDRPPREVTHADAVAPIVSCGRARGIDKLQIVDPQTRQQMPDGQVGEIWVRGPSVASGYCNRGDDDGVFEAQLGSQSGKFLRTGDLGFVDQGELFVTGRAGDLLILRGVNHHPHDIEQTSRTAHRELKQAPAAAFAIERGDEPQLIVVQEAPVRRVELGDEIVATIRAAVADGHGIAPSTVLLVGPGQLPRTSSGKIQRFACRQVFEAGEFSAVAEWRGTRAMAAKSRDSAEGQSLSLDQLAEICREIAGSLPQPLNTDTRIETLALDSLQLMELLSALESRCGRQIGEQRLLQCETLGDLMEAFDEVRPVSPRASQICDGDWQFEQSPEYRSLQQTLQLADKAGVDNPYFLPHEGVARDRTRINGHEYVNFCSYNYLGMSGHPAVTTAAKSALDLYGTSVSASRLVAGERPIHRELEEEIANFIGVDDAITFVGGHSTNETVIGHMFGPGDMVLHDELAHNSIVQGCLLSGAQRRAFPHNDSAACDAILRDARNRYRRVLIAVEGVYSMDGDIVPLPAFVEIKQRHRAYLMVDEAHSLGTIGRTGRGASEHFAVDPHGVDLWMGTLSKSLGSCGGYIAASRAIVEYLRYTAPGFVYSVGLSPPNAAAALESLRLIQRSAGSVMLLRTNSRRFLDGARRIGLDCGLSNATPIVPVILGSSLAALHLSDRLFRDGVNVQPILAPAVPESAARLRFFITSQHTPEQIDHTLDLLARHSKNLPLAA